MANIHRSERKLAKATDFRFVVGIDELSDEELDDRGYYRGFVCPHNHHIRDKERHWCYHCVHKIQSNLCGFDINYLNIEYKARYQKLWAKVTKGAMDECWPIQSPGPYTPKRICMPSYRSAYSHQKAENLSFHKAIYNCAWGDIGSMVVTHLCGNPRCGNPLHLISSWNKLFYPETVNPFEVEFKAEKLMSYGRNKDNPLAFNKAFKQSITFPENIEIPEE